MASIEEFEASFPKNECVLDATRYDFVHDQASVVSCLMRNDLKGRNRFRRLLLGCKAVGKTTLLKSLLTAAKKTYPELITLYVSYAAETNDLRSCICHHLRKSGIVPNTSEFLKEACVDDGPTRDIIQYLQLDVYDLLFTDKDYLCSYGITPGMAGRIVAAASQPPLFERLSALLQSANKKLFLVVDEFQNVYTNSFPKGRQIIGDILALGEDANGQIHCIISGSSTNLRQLAFAKLPETLKSKYPNYTGIDLNSTKYQARWIYPFLDGDSFLCLYRTMKQKPHNYEPSTEEADGFAELFIKTGGSPGGLSECLQGRDSSTYHVSAKSVKFDPEPNEQAQVLQAIYEALPRWCTDNHLTSATATTHLISTHIAKSLTDHPESILYDMADAGLIRYIADNPISKKIGIGSPLVYFTVALQGKLNVTAFEVAALYMPTGHIMGVTAEKVVCRFLAKAFQTFVECPNSVKFSEESSLNLNKEGDEHPVFFEHYVMYKELMDDQDVFGADAVVLIPKQDSTIAHRVQVKLGTSTIFTQAELGKGNQQDSAESIANKFKSLEKPALEAYERSSIPLSESFKYLATTRNITPAARKFLKDNNISILDKQFLFKHVWPEEIKCLKNLPFL